MPSVFKWTLGKVTIKSACCALVCRVYWAWHSAKCVNFAECFGLETRQTLETLPGVLVLTLGKLYKRYRVFWNWNSAKFRNFAECFGLDTRQTWETLPSVNPETLGKVSKVCRVWTPKHSVKLLKFAECQEQSTRQSLHTLPSVTPNTLGKQARNDQILWSLCRVSIRIHSAKKVPKITEISLLVECFGLTLGNASLCQVLHSAKRPIPLFY